MKSYRPTFLDTQIKSSCCGCEACKQVCNVSAITMQSDNEGFRYPVVDKSLCVDCGLCRSVCPIGDSVSKNDENSNESLPFVFGGYVDDDSILRLSSSGGAFTAIAKEWAKNSNYVIFGAKSTDLTTTKHIAITDIDHLSEITKSKYDQSQMEDVYKDVRQALRSGKKVLFSGTPCHISALYQFLNKDDISNLLTVEVICEGVPSPLFIQKYSRFLNKKFNSEVSNIDYRCKSSKSGKKAVKWDFEVMQVIFRSGKVLNIDRWFNPFWYLWLKHYMSRPSCYECQFASARRHADITLGDLWGVHLYCADLYNHNRGASLILCNTQSGYDIFKKASTSMKGRQLRFEDAIKYQSPLRNCISKNPKRKEFMLDLEDPLISYQELCEKWYKKPSLKLLFSKYIWGNQHKCFFKNFLRLY